jgi:hypothetical protein
MQGIADVVAMVEHTEANDINQAILRHPDDICTEMTQLSPSIWSLLQSALTTNFEQLALLRCRHAGGFKCNMGRATNPVDDAVRNLSRGTMLACQQAH